MILDALHAHRKAVLALLSVVLIQIVDANTVDWIVAIAGTLLVGGVANDEGAHRRIYRKR